MSETPADADSVEEPEGVATERERGIGGDAGMTEAEEISERFHSQFENDSGGYSADVSGDVIVKLRENLVDAEQENNRLRRLIVLVGVGLGRELSDAMHECTRLATDGFDG